VTPLTAADLEQPPTVRAGSTGAAPDGAVVLDGDGSVCGVVRDGRVVPAPPAVALGASLRQAFAALAGVDAGFVPVVEDGRYVGAATPEGIYQALRRSAQAVENAASAS
jgi:osmoprotectant transport system ATP-binding protein